MAAVTAAFGIALVPLPARADTALQLGGTPLPSYIGWLVTQTVYPLNAQYFAKYTFVDVPYPQTIGPFSGIGTPTMGQSVATGQAHLDTAIFTASGPILVIGNSQGSLPANGERAKLENDASAPPSSLLSFLVNGDPEQRGGVFSVLFAPGTYIPILDYTVLGPVESQYDTVVFANEYDGIADFPDRPWNLLADLNALFGVAYLHAATGSLNPYAVALEDITVTTNSKNATTTTYLGRAEYLPLTEALRGIGVNADLVDAIDSLLKPIIDAGYSRNDTGPIHGPTFSEGQLHPPTVDLPTSATQREPTADASPLTTITGATDSPEIKAHVVVRTAPKKAVPTTEVDSASHSKTDAKAARGDEVSVPASPSNSHTRGRPGHYRTHRHQETSGAQRDSTHGDAHENGWRRPHGGVGVHPSADGTRCAEAASAHHADRRGRERRSRWRGIRRPWRHGKRRRRRGVRRGRLQAVWAPERADSARRRSWPGVRVRIRACTSE